MIISHRLGGEIDMPLHATHMTILDLVMEKIQIDGSNSPQPRGLSTSNPLGCFIVGLIVLPIITVVVTLVVLLFTLRILTCMNHNDCANEIAQQIWEQLLQDLIPP